MQKEHRDIIRKNWVRLSEETPFPQILTHLFQEKIINKATVEDILWEKPTHRNWAFLDCLQRSGPEAFHAFIRALKNCHRQDLVDLLENGTSF